MIMNDEFRRLQELAGIKEMKVDNPLTVNIKYLETGDKLIVIKTVYWDEEGDKPTLTPQQGEYGVFTYKDDVWELKKDNILVATCIQSNDPYSVGNTILNATIISISRLGAFKHIRKSEVKEIKIGNPIKVDPRRLKVGDNLRVKKEVYQVSDPKNPYGPSLYFNTAKEANAVEPRGNRLSYVNVGDIYTVTGFTLGIDPSNPYIFLECHETGGNIGSTTALRLINFGVFEYA
jgi:hypothetical protein